MSLQTLGFGATSSAADISEDNKDVLIERLNDLVQRLSTDHSLEDKVVSRIHREMDNIEILMLKADVAPIISNELATKKGEIFFPEQNNGFWRPKTPTRKVSIPMPASSSVSVPKEERMSTAVATQVAKEAEELATQLSRSIAELHQRKEEADVSIE
jgi:hypothetical protein